VVSWCSCLYGWVEMGQHDPVILGQKVWARAKLITNSIRQPALVCISLSLRPLHLLLLLNHCDYKQPCSCLLFRLELALKLKACPMTDASPQNITSPPIACALCHIPLCFLPLPHDPVQAVCSVSSMRNHIYSLSRKVLIGFGHMESLPIDLLLGGLTSELAAILAEPCDSLQLGQQDGSSGGSNGSSIGGSNGGSGAVPRSSIGNSAAGTPRDARPSNPSNGSIGGGRSGNEAVGSNGGSDGSPAAGMADVGRIVLPAHVADFLTSALPVPKLALLVFVEFVPVDPAPCSTALPPSGLGAPDGWGNCSSGGRLQQHNPGSKDRRSSSASTAEQGAAAFEGSQGGTQTSGGGNATPRNRNGHHGRWGHGREQRDAGAVGHGNGGPNGTNRLRESGGGGSGNTPNTPRRGSRGNSFSSGGGSGSEANNKRNSSRRSGHGGFDLVAEAAALEAAASAAAPLVAAAVCDLPTSNRRHGSNTGSSS